MPQFLRESGKKFSFVGIISVRGFETPFADDDAAGALTLFDLRSGGRAADGAALTIELFCQQIYVTAAFAFRQIHRPIFFFSFLFF